MEGAAWLSCVYYEQASPGSRLLSCGPLTKGQHRPSGDAPFATDLSRFDLPIATKLAHGLFAHVEDARRLFDAQRHCKPMAAKIRPGSFIKMRTAHDYTSTS